jgi:hypothetical protein
MKISSVVDLVDALLPVRRGVNRAPVIYTTRTLYACFATMGARKLTAALDRNTEHRQTMSLVGG